MHQLIKTNDGSYTLYNSTLDETYHSVNGALTESLHVFIKNGLHYRSFDKNHLHILEVGFGTGLNALLTIENRPSDKNIYYIAVEPFPISLKDSLEYFNKFEIPPQKLHYLEQMLNQASTQFIEIEKGFYFRLLIKPIQDISKTYSIQIYNEIDYPFIGFDIVYFDAFAPQKQADMWVYDCLQGITSQMASPSLLTSYCAQGQFKRNLKSLGFDVHKIDGPPGKREMTVAVL